MSEQTNPQPNPEPDKKRRQTKRRGNGEGSIFQRQRTDGKPGLWAATISLGYGADRKRRRKTVYGETKRDVQEQLAKLQGQKISGTIAEPSKMTLAEFLEYWLENSAKSRCRPSTIDSYVDVIRLHVNPRIGGYKLTKLAPAHVQALYAAMERDGKSPRQRQYVHAILHRAFSRALLWRMIPSNPCQFVERPKVVKKEMKVWTGQQAELFLQAAESDRLYAMYQLALSTGLRQGELFGLTWADIDLVAGRLAVKRTLQERKGRLSLGAPKSKKGFRTVDLTPEDVAALQDHRRRMLAEGNIGSEFVFCSPEGKRLRKSNVGRRSYKRIVRDANEKATLAAAEAGVEPVLIPVIRFHDLRHSNATLSLEAGVPAKSIQERLGHNQISTTLDVYAHFTAPMNRDAAAKIGAVLHRTQRAASPALAVAK